MRMDTSEVNVAPGAERSPFAALDRARTACPAATAALREPGLGSRREATTVALVPWEQPHRKTRGLQCWVPPRAHRLADEGSACRQKAAQQPPAAMRQDQRKARQREWPKRAGRAFLPCDPPSPWDGFRGQSRQIQAKRSCLSHLTACGTRAAIIAENRLCRMLSSS